MTQQKSSFVKLVHGYFESLPSSSITQFVQRGFNVFLDQSLYEKKIDTNQLWVIVLVTQS